MQDRSRDTAADGQQTRVVCAALGDVATSLYSKTWLFQSGNLNSEEPGDQHPALFPFGKILELAGDVQTRATMISQTNCSKASGWQGLHLT